MRNFILVINCVLILVSQQSAHAAFSELAPLASPYSFVVRVSIAEDGGVVRSCSGALVSPWHVLTAAHCVEQALQSSIELTTGERITVVGYLFDADWRDSDNPYAHDTALLRIDSPVTEWRDLGIWKDIYAPDVLSSAGYILTDESMYGWSGTLDSVAAGVLYQERAGEPGMSGAPLLHNDLIVGVHSHRVDQATAYTLAQQALIDQLAADLRIYPASTPTWFHEYLPLLVSNL